MYMFLCRNSYFKKIFCLNNIDVSQHYMLLLMIQDVTVLCFSDEDDDEDRPHKGNNAAAVSCSSFISPVFSLLISFIFVSCFGMFWSK